VKKWITKNSAESENLNWIMANTKPCPKCYRPIEKNQVRIPRPPLRCSGQWWDVGATGGPLRQALPPHR
jgi:hypothetical protein